MKHPILGDIALEGSSGNGLARVLYGDRTIDIRISEDEIPYDAAVDVAAALVHELPVLDAKAKDIAAAALTDTYNNAWREYDEAREDGTLEAVSNPKLTPEEFKNKLALKAVHVTGNMLSFFYDNENMFDGHSVIVTSMDGIAFSKTDVEIFG